MGGLLLHKDGLPYQVLCPTRFYFLMEPGAIDFPLISRQEIADKSHSHPLLSMIFFVQVGWFAVHIISRLAYHLPITQLEVITALIVIIQVLALCFWWSKPLDVRDQYRVDLHPGMDEEQLQLSLDVDAHDLTSEKYDLRRAKVHGARLKRMVQSELPQPTTEPSFVRRVAMASLRKLELAAYHYPSLVYRMDADAVPNGDLVVPLFYSPGAVGAAACIWVLVGPTLLGLAHYFLVTHFVTHREEKIWHIASIMSATAPGAMLLSSGLILGGSVLIEGWIRGQDIEEPHDGGCWLASIVGTLGLVAIIISRGALIVESFLSLRSLPLGAFQVTEWTNYIPHLA